jgi:hypothetical protein
MRAFLFAFVAITLASLGAACASHSELRMTPVGRFDFEGGASDDPARVAEELSGLAPLGGDRYLAISDEHACVHRLRIEVDPESGAIRSAAFEASIPLEDEAGGPTDREGIAVDSAAGEMWISTESAGTGIPGPAIVAYGLGDGRFIRKVVARDDPGLRVFASMRDNRGFESLTRAADGTTWTACEEALETDGALPSDSTGSVVRLQKLDSALRPLAQYAYETDPYTAAITFPPMLRGREASGIADLLALPGGRLLVLERMFAAEPGGLPLNRIRIYEADLTSATDVSKGAAAEGLAGHARRPLRKRRLADLAFPLSNSNFEGIALGPVLANGDRSVILIADNHAGTQQALYALRLAGLED